MPDRTPEPTPPPARRGVAAVRLAAGLAALGCVAATGFWFARQRPVPVAVEAEPAPAPGGKPVAPGGLPLFANWPAGKPEVALVLTGQTYGYLSPCGCSKPQKGGLERRANFIETLKAKGWPVVGLDLGDVAPGKGLAEQNRLKYRTAMKAMADLGYAAVGLGEYDFHQGLIPLLSEYTLQNPNKPPVVLAGNLQGVQRDAAGKVIAVTPGSGSSPAIRVPARWSRRSRCPPARTARPSGWSGSIGGTMAAKVEKNDREFEFHPKDGNGSPVTGPVIRDALAAMAKPPGRPATPGAAVPAGRSRTQAGGRGVPAVQPGRLPVGRARSRRSIPVPVNGGKAIVLQVGQKGQERRRRRGVQGPRRRVRVEVPARPARRGVPDAERPGGREGEQGPGAPGAVRRGREAAGPAGRGPAAGRSRTRPRSSTRTRKLTYVGAAACAKCHAAEFAVWNASKHSQAYKALEAAKRPALRQYDPECVVCHVTGWSQDSHGGIRATSAGSRARRRPRT